MPLDTSIYNQLQPNMAGQLAGSLNQFTENRARLSDLAQQREFQQSQIARQNQLQDYQVRGLQREEDAYPVKQAEAQRKQQEIYKNQLSVATIESLRAGDTPEIAAQKLTPIASKFQTPEQIQQGLTIFNDPSKYNEHISRINASLYPKETYEAGLKENKPTTPSPVNTLMKERAKMAAENPNDPNLKIMDQAIQNSITKLQPLVQVVGPNEVPVYATQSQAIGKQAPQKGGIGSDGVKPMTADQEAKFRESWSKDYKELAGALSTAKEIQSSANKVKTSPGLEGITGVSGYIPSRPGSEASKAMADFETLKGKVTAMGKAVMASSGAMGTMANQEWKIVSDAIAAIDPTKMDAQKLREQIDLIESQAKGMTERLTDAYERQYGAYYEKFPEFKLKGNNSTQNAKPVQPVQTGGIKFLGFE